MKRNTRELQPVIHVRWNDAEGSLEVYSPEECRWYLRDETEIPEIARAQLAYWGIPITNEGNGS